MDKRDQILKLVSEYIQEKHAAKKWEAGKDWVQYSGPVFDDKEYVAATKALLNEWLVLGTDAITFEHKFPPLLGQKYGVVTNSGSSSNLLMMMAMQSKRLYNFPKGTRVITPVAGFPTTLNPTLQVGFEPVFVDIEINTLNLNLDQVEAAAEKGAKILTFAHVLGNCPNMDRVMEIVRKYNLILLEDCCDALGSTYDGQPLGSFGELASCSFYPAHHMSCSSTTPISFIDENNNFQIKKFHEISEKYESCPQKIKVLSFDSNNVIKWTSPSNILKHKIGSKKMYKITSQHGRNVEVTEDHSVFILDDNLRIVPVCAKDIKPTDYIVSSNQFPKIKETSHINLIEWAKTIKNINWNISGFDHELLPIKNKNTHNFKKRNSVPLELLDDNTPSTDGLYIGISQSKQKLPPILKLNCNFARLIGYFLSEGSYFNGGLSISLHKEESIIINDVFDICKLEFDLVPVIIPDKISKGTTIKIYSKTLQIIFKKLLNINGGAKNKRIPFQLFGLSSDVIKSFTYAYTMGDGSFRELKDNHFTIDVTSVSLDLLNDFQYLLSFIGISASFYRRNKGQSKIINKKITVSKDNYSLKFSGWKYNLSEKIIVESNKLDRNKVSEQIPITPNVKKWLANTGVSTKNKTISRKRLIDILTHKRLTIPSILTSNLMFLKVRSVKIIDIDPEEYVYDFSVPNCENFYGGYLGLFMHNTMGEGGFVACRTKEQEKVVRSLREWGRGCYCVGLKANLLKNGTCGCRFRNWIPSIPDEIFDHKYVYEEIGFNLKPIELQCSMGLMQLEKLPEIHRRRRENYARLLKMFSQYESFFHLPRPTHKSNPSWFAFPITLKNNVPFKRKDICGFLEDNKIQTRNYFGGNLLLQPAYHELAEKNNARSYKVATKVTTDTFFLGTSPVITPEQIVYIGEILEKFMKSI